MLNKLRLHVCFSIIIQGVADIMLFLEPSKVREVATYLKSVTQLFRPIVNASLVLHKKYIYPQGFPRNPSLEVRVTYKLL